MFIEREASKLSISKRGLVFGVGINNAPYVTCPKVSDTKREKCPYYSRWCWMLRRSCSAEYKEKNPEYKNTKVCESWKVFTNFKDWMEKQDWFDKSLVKDVTDGGIDIYSPDNSGFKFLRKLLHGVGINDDENLVSTNCPYYGRWSSMITRCYSKKFLKSSRSYIGCYVSDDWLKFSNFKRWMKGQKWEGMALDKDIIRPGNKEYCAEFCAFVEPKVNNLLLGQDFNVGPHPKGVRFDKSRGKYSSVINKNGRSVFLGRFADANEAEKSYLRAKIDYVVEFMEYIDDTRVIKGLFKHIKILKLRLLELEK